MHRQQPRKPHGGNPQSDRAYSKTETGVHKSKLGGTNRQAGSSRDSGGGKERGEHPDSHQSSDSPSQSGETGTEENPDGSVQTRTGSTGKADRRIALRVRTDPVDPSG